MFSSILALALSPVANATLPPAAQETPLLPVEVFFERPPRLRGDLSEYAGAYDDLPPVNLGRGTDTRLIGEQSLLHKQPAPFLRNPLAYVADLTEIDPDELRTAAAEVFPRPVPVQWSLSRTVGGQREVVYSGTESLVSGGVQVVREFQERNRVIELDVEIAMASSIVDPVVETVFEGAGLALAIDSQGDGGCRLEWVLRHLDLEPREPISLQPSPMGDAERNGLRFLEAGGVATVESGEPLEVTLSGGGDSTWTLRLEADTSAVRTRTRAGSVEVLFVPTLFDDATGLRHPGFVPLSPHYDMDLRDMRKPEYGVLQELVGRRVDRGMIDSSQLESGWAGLAYEDESGLLLLDGSDAAPLADALVEVVAREASSHRVMLDVHYSGAAGSEDGVARFHTDVVANKPVAFGIGGAREYLTDWDVEVAQASRIPDPVLSFVDEGIRGDLRVLSNEAGEPWALALDLEFARIHGHETSRLELGPALHGGTMASTSNNSTTILEAPRMAAPVVPIETVERSEQRVHGLFPLKRNGASWAIDPISRGARRMLGAGGELRIEARVQ